MLGVLVDISMGYALGPSNPALLLIRAGFWVYKHLVKLPHGHTATQPLSRRFSVSSDTSPLSRFKLDVQGLLVWHIY
jgi:hypothetical protein